MDQMCSILDELHTYVPMSPITKQLLLDGNEDPVEMEDKVFHRILVGGDQLTTARCRGSAAARSDHQTSLDHLKGLVPVTEDWHAKKTFLMVSMSITYTCYLFLFLC